MKPGLALLVASGIAATAACRSSPSGPRAITDLTGTWVTTDTASDDLRLTLTETGETVGGTGTLVRSRPAADTATLMVFGQNLGDQQCLTVCTPIMLTVADGLGDTLFVQGQTRDATHFVAVTTSSKKPGRFAILTKSTLLFARQ
jgi:hypothetical protein